MGNRAFCSTSVSSMCPKATLNPSHDHELFDDTSACDPAGTVFNETLEDLNEVDRLLLLFSSSTNLAAVRWLFVLGANADACDTNGTTCLHAACRSGSLTVVRELIHRRLPLDATDVAGWTPLHVSLFMGRRGVAIELMQSGADLAIRNARGLLPADTCSDVWMREAINACASHRHCHGLDRPWEVKEADGEDVQVSSRLRFEPFFVPRAAAVRELKNTWELQQIGVEIFEERPGQGLAFLVSTGSVRDFPVELSSFLSERTVSPKQIGEFLGEDYSLAQTLRLEYINAVRLMGTGVVSCLAKVFKHFHIPTDMQKIDRLIDGVAQIWWRQHEQLKEKDLSVGADDPDPPAADGEIAGIQLMKLFSSYDEIHQLMFSSVMLHWSLYAPLPQSQRITPEQWISMNSAPGKPASTNSSKRQAYAFIYNTLSHAFFPQLQIWSTRPNIPRVVSRAPPVSPPTSEKQDETDGWAFLVGGGFPSFAGSSGTITYRHIRSILSETTSTAVALVTPNVSRQHDSAVLADTLVNTASLKKHPVLGGQCSSFMQDRGSSRLSAAGEVVVQNGRQDWVWLSVRLGLLLLAPKPSNWAPYAFINLSEVTVQSMDRASLIITLAAQTSKVDDLHGRTQAGLRCNGGVVSDGHVPPELEGPQLQMVFLLPDGRWQILEVPRLKVQVPDTKHLDRWRDCLRSLD